MGKTLYLRQHTSSWNLFELLGIKVFDVEQFSLRLLAKSDQQRNAEIVAKYFSRQRLIAQCERIFES